MPMYEYVCMKCEEHFEELVRGDQEVACPHCGGTKVARQLSTFATIGTAGQTGAFGGGGCCGGGFCWGSPRGPPRPLSPPAGPRPPRSPTPGAGAGLASP